MSHAVKSTIPALDAPNVSVLVPVMCWKWCPGMVVKRVKSLLPPVLKIALVASVAKLPAPLTS